MNSTTSGGGEKTVEQEYIAEKPTQTQHTSGVQEGAGGGGKGDFLVALLGRYCAGDRWEALVMERQGIWVSCEYRYRNWDRYCIALGALPRITHGKYFLCAKRIVLPA